MILKNLSYTVMLSNTLLISGKVVALRYQTLENYV